MHEPDPTNTRGPSPRGSRRTRGRHGLEPAHGTRGMGRSVGGGVLRTARPVHPPACVAAQDVLEARKGVDPAGALASVLSEIWGW